MVDLMVLSKPASITLTSKVNPEDECEIIGATYTRFDSSRALDSLAVTNLVPIQTAEAPYIKDAATPRPSQMPPAATSCTGCPVKGDLYFSTRSAQAGNKILPICYQCCTRLIMPTGPGFPDIVLFEMEVIGMTDAPGWYLSCMATGF